MMATDIRDGTWTPEQAAVVMLDMAVEAAADHAQRAFLTAWNVAEAAAPNPLSAQQAIWATDLFDAACLAVVDESDVIGTGLGLSDGQRRQFIIDRTEAFFDRLFELLTAPVLRGDA